MTCLNICFGVHKKNMIDLKEYIQKYTIDESVFPKIAAFFQDNDWFGNPPQIIDGQVIITEEQAFLYSEPLKNFLHAKTDDIFKLYSIKFNYTFKAFEKFSKEEKLSFDIRFHVIDFLLYYQEKEISMYNDSDMTQLIQKAALELTKAHGDCLTFFVAWLRTTTKTNYHKDYTMSKRYTMDFQNEAYDFDEYLQLLYYLYSPEYIEDNKMYIKAAESMNYTDTWLYLSMHYICSLRQTDLERIYHPELPYDAYSVINNIKNGTFSDNDARLVVLSINTRMCILPFTPNKTDGSSGISSVKFTIPDSCEVHIGKLFALAEAHRRINGKENTPIIRKISSYEQISRYMGDEIGSLFLYSNFRSRSATKSYLQAIDLLSDDILQNIDDGMHVKGYILAALARSHKGSYGTFASTTFEYLKDAKLSGLTPEFVAFELLERGVLSFVASTLLKMITDNKYNDLSVRNQTKLIQALDMTPHEIESIVSVINKGRQQACLIVQNILASNIDTLTILHRIGSGQAFSKESECLCLCTAMGNLCPYHDKRQCVGCQYEISTKSTFYLLISEYNRTLNLYRSVSSSLEKNKYKKIIQELIIPKLDEMLFVIKEEYGTETFLQYEKIIKENT